MEQIFGQREGVETTLLATGCSLSACSLPRWRAEPWRLPNCQPGEPSWTDGQTIYVDGSAPVRARLSRPSPCRRRLIAAGSLEPDVVRPLVRHPRLARRYLAIEGHRALVSNADLLPGILASMGDRDIAQSQPTRPPLR